MAGGHPPPVSDQPRQSATAESKAVTDASQHEDFPGQLLVTRHHGAIREWARARRAEPVMYQGSGERGDRMPDVSLLLPGDRRGDDVIPVSWERWLSTLTLADLRFIYREHTPEGELSTYFRFDSSSREE